MAPHGDGSIFLADSCARTGPRVGTARPIADVVRNGEKLVGAIQVQGEDLPGEFDERCMRLALLEAGEAAEMGDVPVGAVVVDAEGTVIGRGRNRREVDGDPTAHAEIVAIRQAAARLGTWRLHGATLVSTLEPCVMCAGALVNSRIERVVYGCDDPKAGALRSLYLLGQDTRLNHRFAVTPGVLAGECSRLLSDFFAKLRTVR